MVKVRDGGSVQRKACYLVMAITMDGQREVLGTWFQQSRRWTKALLAFKIHFGDRLPD